MAITPFKYLTDVKTTFAKPELPKPQVSARTPSPMETIEAEKKQDNSLLGARKIDAAALDKEAVRALQGQQEHSSPIATVADNGENSGAYVKVNVKV
jgi:hypothetical protein